MFEMIFGIKKEELLNPVPGRELYKFDKEKITLDDIKKRKKKIAYNHALKLLNYFYFEQFEMYIITGLLAWSGPRVEETVSITIQNIDFENRFIFNILKTTTQEDTYGIYFFPEFFVSDLKLYISQKDLMYPGDEYLFPSPVIQGEYISQKTVRRKIHEACDLLKIDVKITPHRFRGLLIKNRKKKGVDPEDRKILLNHGLDSTQAKSYILDYEDFYELKEISVSSFPYPEFQPNPNYLNDN